MSVKSEWKAGAPWRMYVDGSLMDSGEILESVPQKRLVMSWLSEWKPAGPWSYRILKSLLETGEVALIYHRGSGA